MTLTLGQRLHAMRAWFEQVEDDFLTEMREQTDPELLQAEAEMLERLRMTVATLGLSTEFLIRLVVQLFGLAAMTQVPSKILLARAMVSPQLSAEEKNAMFAVWLMTIQTHPLAAALDWFDAEAQAGRGFARVEENG